MCHKGYQKGILSHICEPICSKCLNGRCISPENCLCDEGFDKINGICVPRCEPKCVNSKCVAPNFCQCLEGYEVKNNSYCSPKCDNCNYGYCSIPNKCTCYKDYEMKNDNCVPICNLECINGECILPNTCQCYEGYQKTNFSNICEKSCLQECVFGNCTDGECICEKFWTGENCNITIDNPYGVVSNRKGYVFF